MNAKKLIESGIEEVTDYMLEQRFNDMLDDCYGTVKIAGLEYSTSDALARIDPIAYRCGLADFTSSELDETLVEIDGKYFSKDDVDSIDEGENE